MGRRENELFIGKDKLTVEGRSIKHPALIKLYANINVNKIKDQPIDLLGLDLETNHKTAELKLLGFHNGEYYKYFTDNFLKILFSYVRYCDRNKFAIAYWNRLDPFVLYKQFLLALATEEELIQILNGIIRANDNQLFSLKRFGKVGGEWDRKKGTWKIKPVVEIKINEDKYFGIKNVVRSSLQFFWYHEGDNYLHTVWAYDIATLYQKGLEAEAEGRLPYYTKVAEEAHLVNWERFDNDKDYRENIVLRSNELDARAVYDLGKIIQEEFKKAFGYYPNTLISQGSLARSAIVATITDKYKQKFKSEEKIQELVYEDIKSIGIINHYDFWARKYGGKFLKDFYCMLTESYSGGYIEAIRFGYTKEAYTADITSAYPAVIKDLYDLRGCEITTGTGEPPRTDHSYCFIRGTVNIPSNVNYHPVTVKHFTNKDTNIRAVGTYVATYTLEERDFLEANGTTFKNETWYNVKTKGKLSPLANACMTFYDLRMRLRKAGNSAQYMAKIAMNSLYGILFEAVDTYEEIGEEIERAGYRAGEFFNPLYASIITCRTRLMLAKSAKAIEDKGGKCVLLMTDSIFWQGKADMLPEDVWTEKKTLGYFEKPEKVTDLCCLGSGRYEYTTNKGKHTAKKRGLNVVDIHDPDGITLNNFNWINALKVMQRQKTDKLNVKVRLLVSVGMVLHNHSYSVNDLGLVKEDKREVDAVVGINKRNYDYEAVRDPELLSTTLLDTEPLEFETLPLELDNKGKVIKVHLYDQTLPTLRGELMKRRVVTKAIKRQENVKRAVEKFRKKNKTKINKASKKMYSYLLELGYTAPEARKMRNWSVDRINKRIKEDKRV